MDDLIRATDRGLYCEAGGFYIDPWRPVDRAVITHAHADHARPGSKRYIASRAGERVLRHRLGDLSLETFDYGEPLDMGKVKVSLHPAGHLLGSSQVRVEHDGRVCVVTGDYKTDADPTCEPFELVPCDHLITECTFGLPIYRWPDPQKLFDDINAWWRGNVEAGKNSVIFAYALGKAQRVLAGLDPSIGPILAHGAVDGLTRAYRESGVDLPPTRHASAEAVKETKGSAMVIAPPSANGTAWMKKLRPCSTAMASGWMAVRGRRRFRSVDRGFVLSDHADWDGLHQTIRDTGAKRIGVTHGYVDAMSRFLNEQGVETHVVPTRFEGESDASDAERQESEPQ